MRSSRNQQKLPLALQNAMQIWWTWCCRRYWPTTHHGCSRCFHSKILTESSGWQSFGDAAEGLWGCRSRLWSWNFTGVPCCCLSQFYLSWFWDIHSGFGESRLQCGVGTPVEFVFARCEHSWWTVGRSQRTVWSGTHLRCPSRFNSPSGSGEASSYIFEREWRLSFGRYTSQTLGAREFVAIRCPCHVLWIFSLLVHELFFIHIGRCWFGNAWVFDPSSTRNAEKQWL